MRFVGVGTDTVDELADPWDHPGQIADSFFA